MAEPQREILIDVRDLKVVFDGKTVLADIDLQIAKGESVSIMGPSGGGKTTLLKCISGLLRPTSGEVRVMGEDIAHMSERRLNQMRRHLGLVFQYAALFDYLTVRENVAFGLVRHTRMGREELEEAVRQKLKIVGLEGTEAMYPSQLSGGMRKRVGLARALALNPSVLLYDEPTSGLDPVTAYAIDSLIVSMREQLGVTSVIVSHDVNSVFRVSDRVAMLSEGRVLAVGTPEEIKHSRDPKVRDFMDSYLTTSFDEAPGAAP